MAIQHAERYVPQGVYLLAERLKRDGVDPAGGTPEAFGALIVREIREWRNLAQSSKITLD